MVKNYLQIMKDIEKLQSEARIAREKEGKEALQRVKQEIALFGFTAEELGVGTSADMQQPPPQALVAGMMEPAARIPQAAPAPAPAEKSASHKAASAKTVAKPPRLHKKKPRRKPTGFKTYRDEKGNVWVGKGHQPQWFKDALTSGKKREEMLA